MPCGSYAKASRRHSFVSISYIGMLRTAALSQLEAPCRLVMYKDAKTERP